MLSAFVTSFGRAFHRRVPSGKIPRWYAKVRTHGPSACRCLYDVVRCHDVNKTMNYSVHHGDAGLRAAFRQGFPAKCFQDGSDAAGSTIVQGCVAGIPVLGRL